MMKEKSILINICSKLISLKVLDVGCCLGTDLRQMIVDGIVTVPNALGVDLELPFIQLGEDLFGDKGKLNWKQLDALKEGALGSNEYQVTFYSMLTTQGRLCRLSSSFTFQRRFLSSLSECL